MITIPKIANITDIRYSWTALISEIEKEQQPLLVVDRSRPKAVILPINLAQKILQLPVKKNPTKKFQFRSYPFGKLKIKLTREYIYD
jgi:hypothetical protein